MIFLQLRPEVLEDWNDAAWSDSKGWSGPIPLLMAGLFNEWHSPEVSSDQNLDFFLNRCPEVEDYRFLNYS